MTSQVDLLIFPSHFPPTTRWEKFFIGVRWLGPDLSFFKKLKALQAARSPEQMKIWGGGLRQEIAENISKTLCVRLGWASSIFLPDDHFRVIAHGPKFDCFDDFALEEATEKIEKIYGISIPIQFWDSRENDTFGKIVDGIVEFKNA